MYLDCNGKHSWTKFQHPECSPETHRPLRPSHTTLQILDKPLVSDLPASGSQNVWWLTTEGRTSRAPRCWADIALKPSCFLITRLWWLKYSRWHELRICLAWSCHPAVSSARPRSDRLKKTPTRSFARTAPGARAGVHVQFTNKNTAIKCR